MTGYALTVLALCAAVGATAGAFAIPRIADMLLSRAYWRSYTWWYRCLDDFAHYRDVCPDRLPRQNEKGTAGAVGIWLADCRSQALKGGAHARTRRSASGGGHRCWKGRLDAKRGRAAAALLVLPAAVAASGARRRHGVVVRGPAAVRRSVAPRRLALRMRRGHGVWGGV